MSFITEQYSSPSHLGEVGEEIGANGLVQYEEKINKVMNYLMKCLLEN